MIKMKFATKVIHGANEPEPCYGAVNTPVYQSSTYAQISPGKHKGYEYSRSQNPTRTSLEKCLALLENAKYAYTFSSGLAAIDAVLKILLPGEEIIASNDLYGGSYRLFKQIFEKFGLHFTFIDLQNPQKLENYISKKTKLIWIETPSNPLMKIIDIESVANISKKYNILLAVDNTFASPYLQNPLDLGADIVMHSITKYIAGHSDLIMGAIMCNDINIAEKIYFNQYASGAVPGPQDCYLALRGIKTLHVRMDRQCKNAHLIAEFLNSHKNVKKVFWPGFINHPNHNVAKKQMKSFGAVISFLLNTNDKKQIIKFLSSTKIFTLAESLGGVESLINHPATMAHASIPENERKKIGISDNLIRLSVGIEDADDLIYDLNLAFKNTFYE